MQKYINAEVFKTMRRKERCEVRMMFEVKGTDAWRGFKNKGGVSDCSFGH